MALDLTDYEQTAKEAIKAFWGNREKARLQQIKAGRADQGERASVTAGKNLDGFIALMLDLITANGLGHAAIHRTKALVTLPGYFRPTKLWDLLVLHRGRLVAAIELKSQVGPSFGNNFNNRVEEAVGTAHDFWTAYREGAFGDQPKPFVGWLMVVEDAPKSRSAVKDKSSHFESFPEFHGSSYLQRYELLCQRLAKERLYSAASVIATPRHAASSGEFCDLSDMTGLKSFIATFAGHIAAEAARTGFPHGSVAYAAEP